MNHISELKLFQVSSFVIYVFLIYGFISAPQIADVKKILTMWSDALQNKTVRVFVEKPSENIIVKWLSFIWLLKVKS